MKGRPVITVFRLVMRDEEFTLDSLATTLRNEGDVTITINRNLNLDPNSELQIPYCGAVNRTTLEIEFDAPGTHKLLVITTEYK